MPIEHRSGLLPYLFSRVSDNAKKPAPAVSGSYTQNKTLEASQLGALKDIPIQIFQGGKDEKLPIEDAQQIVDTLRGLGGTVDFTVLSEGDHFIADEVYSDPKLQQWLISQSHRTSVAV